MQSKTDRDRIEAARPIASLLPPPAARLVVGVMCLTCVALAGLLSLVLSLQQPAVALADAASIGQWSPVITTWPIQTVHSTLLPTGNVVFWPAWDNGADVQIWNPNAGTINPGPRPNFDPFCTAHVLMADGRLFVTGGHVPGGGSTGLTQASYYNPFSNGWTSLPSMNARRWYPTNTVLASGDVLTSAGYQDSVNGDNPLPQVWQAAAGTWRNLTGARKVIITYPFMFLAPNGRVFHAGAEQTTEYLNTSGTGSWSVVGDRKWGVRAYGTAVMYDDGKVLTLGGGDPPTATAEVIDLNSPTPAWRLVAPMAYARRQANATLLPDGTVLISGGHGGTGNDDPSHPVYPAELWDPATETFRVVDSLSTYRGYHSVAHLIPDGKVFSAGGEPNVTTAELYSPPYLFNGPQPTITAAPNSVVYGQSFTVQSADAASITRATWIRLGSNTHAFDQDQRINRLSFTRGAGSLTITAPSDPNRAPPGYYMLFILNASGVPSEARFVRLDLPTTRPVAPSGLAAQALSTSSISLTWRDNSNNESSFEIARSTNQVNWVCCSTVGTGVTTFTSTGLSSNTLYYFRVRAANWLGRSGWSNVASARTQ
jgi:hypothetical protein